MKQTLANPKVHPKYIYQGVILVLLISTSSLGYLYYQSYKQVQELSKSHADTKDGHASSTAQLLTQLENASSTISELSSRLSLTAEELATIETDLVEEKNRNEDFEDQIRKISGTVGDLDKLSKTDKELLQKYSKVYFLNEHYVPEKIVPIEKKYLYNESVSKSIHSRVNPYLEDMIEDALNDGIKIWVVSGYRSFNEQAGLKSAYTRTYGSGANTFSADQGFSEHQLGTAVDFTTTGLNGGLSGFENTDAYQWLIKNAHKYGFTLSYPEGNAYYVYEPWHWRFVGKDLASDLKKSGDYFYDWEQRKIDEYLLDIFD